MIKAATYARYSSDNQRDASIADQLQLCGLLADREGWRLEEEYSDHAVSGATLLRPGFQALMRDALKRRFDVVLAESLDRFSRDQEDIAGFFKRLTFIGVRIITLAEGEINHLHVGLKGTMKCALPEGPGRQDPAGPAGACRSGKVRRRQPANARSTPSKPRLFSAFSATMRQGCHQRPSPSD